MDAEEKMREEIARSMGGQWNKRIMQRVRARQYAIEQHYAELAAADKRRRAWARKLNRKLVRKAREVAKARKSPKVAPARTPSVFDLVGP